MDDANRVAGRAILASDLWITSGTRPGGFLSLNRTLVTPALRNYRTIGLTRDQVRRSWHPVHTLYRCGTTATARSAIGWAVTCGTAGKPCLAGTAGR